MLVAILVIAVIDAPVPTGFYVKGKVVSLGNRIGSRTAEVKETAVIELETGATSGSVLLHC